MVLLSGKKCWFKAMFQGESGGGVPVPVLDGVPEFVIHNNRKRVSVALMDDGLDALEYGPLGL